MNVVDVEIEKLIPADYNPRLLTEKAKAEIWESILQFGMVEPIVVNNAKGRENIIIGGHQRWYICKEMGKKTMPVVYITIDDLEREKELNLRLNKNVGDWDWDMLANFDEQMLRTVGFDEELDRLFQKEVEEDEAPEVSQEPAISKLGEVYQLGKHRVMCGDSTKIEDVEKLMDGQKADLLLTDPPYGVSYIEKNAAVHGDIVLNAVGKQIENDTGTLDEMFKLWSDIFSLDKYFTDTASYYVFSPQGGDLMMMMMSINNSKWQLKHTLIWAKQNFVFGRADYHYQHEPILYGWKKDKSHDWYGDRKQGSVLNFDKANRNDLHPTMKPIVLLAYLLNNSSKQDDIVLDLFGGSGSTLIACEQTNRTCYMMEIDPKYIDVIRKRYAKFIGKESEWQSITKPL